MANAESLGQLHLAFTGMVDEGPYPHGPIYMRDYRFQIFVTRADGSDLQQVNRESDPDALDPIWDQDGKTLTYRVAYRQDHRRDARYRVRFDGSAPVPVAIAIDAPEAFLQRTYGYNQVYPSPDRSLFAVTSLADEDVSGFWLVRATGEPLASCAPLHRYIGVPTWSPDGAWIAFTAADDDAGNTSSLFAVECATGVVNFVCSDINMDGYLFAWAPDSRQLVAVRHAGDYAAAFIVKRDGTGLRHIMDLNVGDASGEIRPAKPAWSPDGRYLAVSTLAAGEAFEIVIFTAAGQHQQTLTWPTPVLARIDDLAWRPLIDQGP